jgi:fatty acid elongase 3
MTLADVLLQFIPYNPLPRYLSEYQPGVTPLSDTTPVVATLIAYLVTIFSIRWFMEDKAPLKLTFFFQSHNLFLTVISGLLLVLIAEEILPIWWRTGFFDAICHPRSWTEVLLLLRALSESLLSLMTPRSG